MKQVLSSILEALFIPKPNGHLHRDYTDNQYGRSLIFIPVPNRSQDQIVNKRENR
jgi:hypothetical protein